MTNFFLIVCFFVDKAKKNGYNSFSHTCDLRQSVIEKEVAMAITMTEVAKQLNLSHSTVSLVLNNRYHNRVRPEVAARILSTAKELGYRPNRAASELRRQRSNNIGILLPSTRNFFYGEMVADLHQKICQLNYSPIFAFWDLLGEQQRAVETILSWQTEAIITVEPSLLPRKLDIPVASFYNADPRFDLVELNLPAAMTQILRYLYELGHRRIAWLGNREDLRYKTLVQQAPKFGIAIPPEFQVVGRGVLSFADGSQFFDRLLEQSRGRLPTAIIAHNDMVAIGIIRQAVKRGYRIPEDFSLVGQDDIVQAEFSLPTLTTIHYADGGSVAKMLVDTVFRRLKCPELPRQVVRIEPTLIKRESCGVAPSNRIKRRIQP